MGFNYDDNGKFIGWSSLFNYKTASLLKASMQLPTPARINYVTEPDVNSIDITESIKKIISAPTEENRILQYAKLLNYLEKQEPQVIDGRKKLHVSYNYLEVDSEKANAIIQNLNNHEFTEIPKLLIEDAYKNSVSAKIQLIVQNLRNMDSAYSPIEMDKIRSASKRSPKGSLTSNMTLMNPTTKFVMQVQNMVGKGVIGISAVGEKVFFNVSTYWNEGIRRNDPDWARNMRFCQTFNNIQGRASGHPQIVTKTTVANINFEGNEMARLYFSNALGIDEDVRNELGITDDDIQRARNNGWNEISIFNTPEGLVKNNPDLKKYLTYKSELFNRIKESQDTPDQADLLISELLSAATDNAKELILHNINAGTNLARMYLHLIMMGFSIDDIVSYMTSPAVSLINNLSEANMFDEYVYETKVLDAVNIINGKISPNTFLNYMHSSPDSNPTTYKQDVLRIINKNYARIDPVSGKTITYKYLDNFVTKLFNDLVNKQDIKDPRTVIDEAGIGGTARLRAHDFFDYVYMMAQKVINAVEQTGSPDAKYSDKLAQFYSDITDFRKIWDLATETSTLGSTFLGLNQGLPSSKYDLLQKLNGMEMAVSKREDLFGISKYIENKKILDKGSLSSDKRKQLQEANDNIISSLHANNRLYEEQYIIDTLNKAIDDGIAGNFSMEKYLMDDEYKKGTIEYYNIIKGTWNVFDIVDKLPQYNSIMKLLKLEYISDDVLTKKGHILNLMQKAIIKDSGFIDERMQKGLLHYIDDLLIVKWLNSLSEGKSNLSEDEKEQSKYELPVFEGSTYFSKYVDRVKSPSSFLMQLNESCNLASFKYIMENEIIPNLKQGILNDVKITKDNDGNIIKIEKVEKPVDPNNAFIQELVDTEDQGIPFMKLDIDLLNTDATIASSIKYQELLDGLYQLKGITLNGRPLSDWFMLYNFVVNKNNYGSDRMTSMFKQFISLPDTQGSLINSYFKFIGDYDYSSIKTADDLESLGFSLKDAYIRTAPLISEAQEVNSKSPVVMEHSKDKNGSYIYKKRDTYGNYQQFSILPKKIASGDGNQNVRLGRLRDYQQFFTIKTPMADSEHIIISGLLSNENKDIARSLIDYMSDFTILVYKQNC